MKLGINDNSIRLRLTRTEVDNLRESGVVAAKTGFPGGKELQYRVESSPANVSAAALFSNNALSVRLPESAVLAWATSEQVSLPGEQLLDNGELLKILVEKDFVSATGSDDEDESESYPHPAAGTDSR